MLPLDANSTEQYAEYVMKNFNAVASMTMRLG
jgi:hypothetical protein